MCWITIHSSSASFIHSRAACSLFNEYYDYLICETVHCCLQLFDRRQIKSKEWLKVTTSRPTLLFTSSIYCYPRSSHVAIFFVATILCSLEPSSHISCQSSIYDSSPFLMCANFIMSPSIHMHLPHSFSLFLRSAICACFIHVVCTWAVYSASTSKITDMSLHVILYPIAFQQDIIFYDFLWLGLLYSFVLWTTLFLLGGNAVLGVSGFLWVGAFALIILLLTAANHCLYISFLCQVIFALYGIQFGTRSLPWLCFLHCVWVFFRVHPSAFVILIKLLFQALY